MTISNRTSLTIPVVLWGRKHPHNKICQVTCLRNGQTIVTGSVDGQIIQWSVNETLNWIQPQIMMLVHECEITCISPTSSSSTKYVTCSQDGHVCLWDSVDGRVIESVHGNYVHRQILSYTVNLQQPQTLLFCIGDYPEIIVMDSQDLNVLFNLSSKIEPDWINTMTIVQPQNKIDVTIGVSLSGIIKLWSLNNLDKKNDNHVIYEDESKAMHSRNVNYIHCSKLNTRMMLVICSNSWQIVDPSNLNQLIVSECAIEAISGIIIDIDKIAIGFADSTIILFQLPRSKLCGRQIREKFGENPQNIGNIDQPFVFALVKEISTTPLTPLSNPVKFHFDVHVNTEGKEKRVAYRVEKQGTLSVWHIPKNFNLLIDEFIQTKRPVVYEPTMRQTFKEVWNRLIPQPSICGPDDGQLITCILFVSNQGKLFLGREDGSIVMMSACHAIMLQLLETTKQEILQHRLLHGHSGAINCFLYPFEHSARYDPQIFLSGGADFAVIVWNVTTGSKIYKFSCQGGPVLKMLIPPANCNPRVLHTICSLAGDNSAALLSLRENKCLLLANRQQFPIVDVKWRPLDDFMLLRCEDNSVYVWEVETSNLDRIVTGLVTEDIINACIEQSGLIDSKDESNVSNAIQMLRSIKNKNIAEIKKIAFHQDEKNSTTGFPAYSPGVIAPPMNIIQLKKCADEAQLILFNVDNLIAGLLAMDYELSSSLINHPHSNVIGIEQTDNKMTLSSLISKAEEHLHQNHLPYVQQTQRHSTVGHNYSASTQSNNLSNSNSATLANQNNKATNNISGAPSIVSKYQTELALYLDTARLLLSLLYGWDLDENLDAMCIKNLKLLKPKLPICYGTISRKNHVSLYMPYSTGKLPALENQTYKNFAINVRWQQNRTITTAHLLSIIALSNTLMFFKSKSLQLSVFLKRPGLRQVSSTKSTDNIMDNDNQQTKKGWSNVAAMHCVLLSDLVKPANLYASPKIDLLARRWQDNCTEIRDAAQALLIREMERLGPQGRKKIIDYWSLFLPSLLNPLLSIFGVKISDNLSNCTFSQQNIKTTSFDTTQTKNDFQAVDNNIPTKEELKPSQTNSSIPAIPPRQRKSSTSLPVVKNSVFSAVDSFSKSSANTALSTTNAVNNTNTNEAIPSQTQNNNISKSIPANSNSKVCKETLLKNQLVSIEMDNENNNVMITENEQCGGIHQIRRNQATAIVVLSVIGAEFPSDLLPNVNLVRATAYSLLDLLTAPESPLLPLNSPLRRAAIDLLGRGFIVWQPHLDISKVLLVLLEIASGNDKCINNGSEYFGAPLTPAADACRAARHSLSYIASSRPQVLITALSMEVARYNAATQHQTIQLTLTSPLLKYRNEVLRLIEHLAEKQYNSVVDLIIPVGDILVHCLDTSLLKQRTLAEIFPPIAKFYMVAYCSSARRIAFGGKNGLISIHELRASKAQMLQAHKTPITALAFSQDGKYLAVYASQDAKISFWQTHQSFLGMGQNQIKFVKTLPAPSEFPVNNQSENYQLFRARLVWINAKSLTLMLPNGKEHRFAV